jgi:RNA polymerase sigma-70 factor (ECF subfamily)
MTFRELYDAHFDFVVRSLRRLGVHDSDLSDATQEVFVVVHRKLPEFEGRAKLTTWIFAICMRVASDRRRRVRSRREVLGDDEAIRNVPDEHPDAFRTAERREQAALVEQILDSLPMEQRVVFVLFELEEMSGDEIAKLLELPTGTVRSRLRLGRETFRATLARFEARRAKRTVE